MGLSPEHPQGLRGAVGASADARRPAGGAASRRWLLAFFGPAGGAAALLLSPRRRGGSRLLQSLLRCDCCGFGGCRALLGAERSIDIVLRVSSGSAHVGCSSGRVCLDGLPGFPLVLQQAPQLLLAGARRAKLLSQLGQGVVSRLGSGGVARRSSTCRLQLRPRGRCDSLTLCDNRTHRAHVSRRALNRTADRSPSAASA